MIMNRWILVAILLLAAFFRLYRSSTVPPTPSLDEVSIGYNAYSILQTGKDEYDTPFPLLLRAYDDWRPALYVYLVIPFIKFIGLSALAVRLPSVILSILTVFITYFLVKELLKKSKFTIQYSLFTCLLLALSPWHIYVSRLGHEVNVGLFANVAGAYFFLVAIERKTIRSLIMSTVFFVLALYSYQSQKIIVPVVILGLGILYSRQLWEMKKGVAVAAIIFTVFLTPLVQQSLTQGALVRFQATSAFTLDNPEMQKSQGDFIRAKISNDIVGQIISHRWVTGTKIFWANYISHFDPRWLFFGSERENHKVPRIGLLYWWELPLVILGLIKLLSRQGSYAKSFIILWLLISPLPAAITTQAPHAMRDISVLPYWQIIGAIGAMSLWTIMKQYRVFVSIGAVIIFAVSVWYFTRQYYDVFPQTQSDSFQHALTQAVLYAGREKHIYGKIIFSNQNNLYQSYMFYLFHSGYDPRRYLANGGTKSGGFAEPHAFDTFEFRPIDWSKDSKLTNTLIIGNVNDFPAGAPILKQFAYLDNTVGIVAIKL